MFEIMNREKIFILKEIENRGNKWVGNLDEKGKKYRIMISVGGGGWKEMEKKKMERIKDWVREELREVKDKEIEVNIVDIGMIYEVEISDEGMVNVKMKKKKRGWNDEGFIKKEVKEWIEEIEGVKGERVEMKYEKEWKNEMDIKEVKEIFEEN